MQNAIPAQENKPPLGRLIILAGLAGGLAEVIWVGLYSALTGLSAAEVARQITATVVPFLAAGDFAVISGLAIHMLLSFALAAGFILVLAGPLSRMGAGGLVLGGPALLAAVWTVNFFVLLPILNPAFTALMPYTVTLASKLLFGVAMAWVLASAGKSQRYRIVSTPSM